MLLSVSSSAYYYFESDNINAIAYGKYSSFFFLLLILENLR
jgi:hypothetical protein